MVRGGDFYAIWNESRGCWSRDLDDVVTSIDGMMEDYKKNNPKYEDAVIKYMKFSSSGSIDQWWKYVKSQLRDNYHPLDQKLVFLNDPPRREDYSSKHLDYELKSGDYSAWDELVGTLYESDERHKIEWAIGAVVSGDSKQIQKFLVLYGDSGTGKSTILNIICELFKGYYAMFIAKELASSTSDFSLEAFKDNPLVAIQQDGDLSHIEDNTKLNSLVSHEEMVVNMKFTKKYTASFNAMLFMGTNKPVKITDSKSGIIRRLIDVKPSGNLIRRTRYNQLMKQIKFELGAIATHCLEVYKENPNAYDDYIPITMIGATNDFYIFLEENYDYILKQEYVTLSDMYNRYLIYCSASGVTKPYQRKAVKEELKNYFNTYRERKHVGNEYLWNIYEGFKIEKFNVNSQSASTEKLEFNAPDWLQFNTTVSQFDKIGADWPAQYAFIRKDGSDKPMLPWEPSPSKLDIPYCETVLADLNTSELHYVRPPEDIRSKLVTVDFDKKDPETGEKSLELNIKAASDWLPTYAELSKSGVAIHLEYFYTGDVSKLAPVYEPDVEIKIFTGKASLRRKLTRCNDLPIATISSGLPLRKEVKKTVDEKIIKDEKHLRNLINKALRKEVEPFATVTCINFIGEVLKQAQESGIKYDVSDLKSSVLAFAMSSTHNAIACIDKVAQFQFKSEEESTWVPPKNVGTGGNKKIAFFDTEVYLNLFVLCYKPLGETGVPLINPTPNQVLDFFQNYNAVGFNNLGYDNTICMMHIQGASNYEKFVRSQNIINNGKGRNDYIDYNARNLSYTDVFDFCSKKQGLKKWEIELQKKGVSVRHDEAGIPWDKPVPENKWNRVAEYCMNDVEATEQVFLANQSDFRAREILVELANALRGPGSTVNDMTNTLTAKLIVGNDKNPQALFNYPDLSKEFPGYEFNPYGIDRNRYYLPVSSLEYPNPALHQLCEINEEGKYVITKDSFALPGKQYYKDTFISGKSFYKGFDPGEGGFVFAKWGMYFGAECYDSASHHPSSIIAENGFGPYTDNFKMLLDIRLHIKHKDYDWVRGLHGGILAPYLTSDEDAKQLSQALKIAINSVYGLTAAHFTNKLRDPRNVDNWVAKRGALFMIDLMLEVKKLGYEVIHVKTDSIKIAHPDQKIFQFVYDYGKKFGYTFEIEHKFDRICLVNNAVYICKYTNDPENGKVAGLWEGTGDQFKEASSPYEFKTLFSHADIDFYDLCVTQTVKVGDGIYLDMDENLPDSELLEKEEKKLLNKWNKVGFELSSENDQKLNLGEMPSLTDVPDKKAEQYAVEAYHADYVKLCQIQSEIERCHDYHFVGKAGLFCPMMPGSGGGRLVRENNGRYAYVSGSKGYRWLEAETVKELKLEDYIDISYFEKLKEDAKKAVAKFGDYDAFVLN